MFKRFFRFIQLILASQWTVTLFATMTGVFMAILLEGYISNKRLKQGKGKALVEIGKELSENETQLKAYNEILHSKYEATIYALNALNEDLKLIIKEEEIPNFRKQTESFIIIEDSSEVRPGYFQFKGEFNFEINSKLILSPLSNISWSSYKQTQFMTITEFNCVNELELIYNIQEQVNEVNEEWANLFFKAQYVSDLTERKTFISTWKNLLMHHDILLKLYENKEDILQRCN